MKYKPTNKDRTVNLRPIHHTRMFCALSMAVIATVTTTATAGEQNSSPETVQRDLAKNQLLEEVVVYARKRQESLQKIPIALSAFGETDLDEVGVISIEEVGHMAPNLLVHESAAGYPSAVACMRGLCRTDTVASEDPMVGTYIDGVYVSKAIGSMQGVVDLERVEVLRGPQGTLYGKNTLGGAISLITKKPSGEWGVKSKLAVGNFGKRDLNLSVDFPIVGSQLAGKLSLMSKEHDGFVDNRIGDDIWDEDKQAGRLALRATPSDALTIDYSLDIVRNREKPGSTQIAFVRDSGTAHLAYFFGAGQDLRPSAGNGERLDTRSIAGEQVRNLDVEAHSLTFDYDLGQVGPFEGASIKAISGYRDVDAERQSNYSPFWFMATAGEVTLESFSQELQFQGATMDDRLKVTAGLYYFDEDVQEYGWSLYSGWFLEQPRLQDVDNASYAAFGETSYAITPELSLTLGMRYTVEDKEAQSIYTYMSPPASSPRPGVMGTAFIDTHSNFYDYDRDGVNDVGELYDSDGDGLVDKTIPGFDTAMTNRSFTPRISLAYDFPADSAVIETLDSLMVFGTYARGFKSGGFNLLAASSMAWEPYDDVELDSYELGFKSELWGRRARLNATLFYENIDEMQVQNNVTTPTGTFQGLRSNAGEATIWGMEIDGLIRPLPGLELQGSWGYQDSGYDKYDFNGVDVADERVFEFTPRYTYFLSTRYEFPAMDIGTLSVRLDWHGMGAHHFQSVRVDEIKQGAYDLLDLRISLDDVRFGGGDGALSFAFWGKNLGDEEYRIGGFDFGPGPGIGFSAWGARRTYGLEVSYRWGSEQ